MYGFGTEAQCGQSSPPSSEMAVAPTSSSAGALGQPPGHRKGCRCCLTANLDIREFSLEVEMRGDNIRTGVKGSGGPRGHAVSSQLYS